MTQVIGIVSDGYGCRKCADLLKARFHEREDKTPEGIAYCAKVIQGLVTRTMTRQSSEM
jgi:hypothetical protein